MVLIDADAPASWPGWLIDAVAETAQAVQVTPTHTSDLSIAGDARSRLHESLTAVRIRAFHATRALPTELAEIQRGGLRLLNEELVCTKLRHAVEAGVLSAPEAEELYATRTPLDGSAGRRSDQICAFAGTEVLHNRAHGVAPLLKSWGGEAIYFPHGHDELGHRLRRIGEPALVELSVAPNREQDAWYPSIENLLLGAWFQLEGVSADIFIRSGQVPASDILAIRTPDEKWWPKYPGLPLA